MLTHKHKNPAQRVSVKGNYYWVADNGPTDDGGEYLVSTMNPQESATRERRYEVLYWSVILSSTLGTGLIILGAMLFANLGESAYFLIVVGVGLGCVSIGANWLRQRAVVEERLRQEAVNARSPEDAAELFHSKRTGS